MMRRTLLTAAAFLVAGTLASFAPVASADDTLTIEITVKDHQFTPAEAKVPAGKPIVFKVKNRDAAPIEFESDALEFETVVKPNTEGLIKVKAQKAGRYEFFDDLHQATKGYLVVE
jgi:plastocyanin